MENYARLAMADDVTPASRDDPLTGRMMTYGMSELTAQYAAAGWRYKQAIDTPLTPHAIRVLRNIMGAKYHRTATGFRALPVMGSKPPPMIRYATLRPLLLAKFVAMDDRGRLYVTAKGKRRALDK